MSRKGISKQQIFQEIKEIVFSNQNPTAFKIRAKLKTGSIATIQKYLQEWKINCFKRELNLDDRCNEIIEKNRLLEQRLSKQISKNENYVQELIDTEKANLAIKEQNNSLQTMVTSLQQDLQQYKAVNSKLEEWYQKLYIFIDNNNNQIIKEQQKIINDLRQELKTLNETSIAALRETSNQGHEALMQERVISINLQAKIDSLTKELLQSKKQLHEAIMTSQVQNRSLSRQNEELQKIIQDLEKLPELEGSSLQLANGVAAHGK